MFFCVRTNCFVYECLLHALTSEDVGGPVLT